MLVVCPKSIGVGIKRFARKHLLAQRCLHRSLTAVSSSEVTTLAGAHLSRLQLFLQRRQKRCHGYSTTEVN